MPKSMEETIYSMKEKIYLILSQIFKHFILDTLESLSLVLSSVQTVSAPFVSECEYNKMSSLRR